MKAWVFLKLNGEGAAQQTHQGAEPGPIAARFHISRQRHAGAGGAAGAEQPVEPVLHRQLHTRRDLVHLMLRRNWVLALQHGVAAAAGVRVVVHNRIHPLNRQQPRPSALMPQLATALAATALALIGWLKARPIAAVWFRGMP